MRDTLKKAIAPLQARGLLAPTSECGQFQVNDHELLLALETVGRRVSADDARYYRQLMDNGVQFPPLLIGVIDTATVLDGLAGGGLQRGIDRLRVDLKARTSGCDQTLIVLDGKRRFAALGARTPLAYVKMISPRDLNHARVLALRENAQQGRPLSPQDRNALIDHYVTMRPESQRSCDEIARELHLPVSLVRSRLRSHHPETYSKVSSRRHEDG